MKKTLKTLINTGLFMLFFSHSHGLALVYNLNDVINQDRIDTTILLDNTTHPGFNGIDDTFGGSVTFNFTLTYEQYSPGRESSKFNLVNNNDYALSIGAIGSSNWNGEYDIFAPLLDFGSNPIIEGQPQGFTLTIDYNAGAPDTGTVVLAGDPTVYNLVDRDYSFNGINFSTFNDPNNKVTATNMSVSIVPEPATYAFLSGALALVFVAVRQRFKA